LLKGYINAIVPLFLWLTQAFGQPEMLSVVRLIKLRKIIYVILIYDFFVFLYCASNAWNTKIAKNKKDF